MEANIQELRSLLRNVFQTGAEDLVIQSGELIHTHKDGEAHQLDDLGRCDEDWVRNIALLTFPEGIDKLSPQHPQKQLVVLKGIGEIRIVGSMSPALTLRFFFEKVEKSVVDAYWDSLENANDQGADFEDNVELNIGTRSGVHMASLLAQKKEESPEDFIVNAIAIKKSEPPKVPQKSTETDLKPKSEEEKTLPDPLLGILEKEIQKQESKVQEPEIQAPEIAVESLQMELQVNSAEEVSQSENLELSVDVPELGSDSMDLELETPSLELETPSLELETPSIEAMEPVPSSDPAPPSPPKMPSILIEEDEEQENTIQEDPDLIIHEVSLSSSPIPVSSSVSVDVHWNAELSSLLQKILDEGIESLWIVSEHPIFLKKPHSERINIEQSFSREEVLVLISELPHERGKDLSFGQEWNGIYKAHEHYFRVRISRDVESHLSLWVKLLSKKFSSAKDLNLPQRVLELWERERGLVLIAGHSAKSLGSVLEALQVYFTEAGKSLDCLETSISAYDETHHEYVRRRELGWHFQEFREALGISVQEDFGAVWVDDIQNLDTASALLRESQNRLIFGALITPSLKEAQAEIQKLFSHASLVRQQEILRCLLYVSVDSNEKIHIEFLDSQVQKAS